MAAVGLQSLRKTFGPIEAVHDLTLQVERGEVFGFLGPNGGTRFLWTQVERGGGDSGGPYYTSEDANGDLDPEFYIAGIHEGGRVYGCSSGCSGDYYATGPYIGDIENYLNVNA